MKIKANAKINLSLCIRGKREDGYHLIDTVMQSVSLYDEITITKASNITVNCDKYQIDQQDNIAYKAAKLFFEKYGVSGGVNIAIKKNIPSPAGLGGGSADAAAVLLALNRLYKVEASEDDLEKIALKLGADVPFFIKGGCRRAEGIGEVLTDATPLEEGYILLAIAEQKPSTGEMYQIIDNKPYIQCDTEAVIEAIGENDLFSLSHNLCNAFAVAWEESFVKKALLSQHPIGVSLSGSGPTWFAIFEDKQQVMAAKKVLEQQKIKCWVTVPQNRAIIFE